MNDFKISFVKGLLQLVDKTMRLRIGQLIRQKRKALNLNQAQFGIAIWENDKISPNGAQSKISRIERGDLWPIRQEMFKIFEYLDIWDEIFEWNSSLVSEDIICIDKSWENYIPNLKTSINQLSYLARKGQRELFYRQLRLICDMAEEKSK